jgi:hypothetical protein
VTRKKSLQSFCRYLPSYLAILIASACVDRVFVEIPINLTEGISISGFISDQPGPYEVKIYQVFDTESRETLKKPVTVKSLSVSDNHGTSESFYEVSSGIYSTSENGIQGRAGHIYKLRLELFDGKVFESLPDTILSAGKLDSMHIDYKKEYGQNGVEKYGFDASFDASNDPSVNNRLMWDFSLTFKAITQPEFNIENQCFYLDEIQTCNFVPPCSGYRNVGTLREPRYEKKYPCTCCTCWYSIYNDHITLSDSYDVKGNLKGVFIKNITISPWMLQFKIRIAVTQFSLSHNAFRFWKAVKNQQDANGNLFQPISGKIPRNFIQMSGEQYPVEGIFYAAAVSQKVQTIKRLDLPVSFVYQIPMDSLIFSDDCKNMPFPNSTYVRPSFWKD